MVKSFKEISEDLYASEYKIKQWVDPATGKTKTRKIRDKRIQFKASKLHAAQDAKDEIPDYLKTEEVMEELQQELHEVLSKDAKAGDWIHDFVHSDNPKFAGKSKKERIQMALGAYYAKQRNEETELGEAYGRDDAYTRDYKSSVSGFGRKNSAAYHADGGANDEGWDDEPSHRSSSSNVPHAVHINGKKWKTFGSQSHAMNVAKKIKGASVHKEEVRYIDERNKKNALMRKVMDAARGARFKAQGNVVPDAEPQHKTAQAHNKAIGRALRNEEVKTTHEDPLVTVHDKHGLHTHANLSTANHIFNTSVKHTDVHAGPVQVKSGHDDEHHGILTFAISKHHATAVNEAKDTVVKDAKGNLVSFKHEGDWKKVNPKKNPEGKVHNLAGQALKKAQELSKEEVELEEATYAGLEKEDKPGKIKTAVVKVHPKGVESETVEGWKDPKKPVKESYEEENNMSKTYQEFMEGMIATKVAPNVTRYTGGSYGNAKGAKYGNTDYDKETLDTKDDESGEPQAKRGRGRPAGAKSGARKITGTSKLYK